MPRSYLEAVVVHIAPLSRYFGRQLGCRWRLSPGGHLRRWVFVVCAWLGLALPLRADDAFAKQSFEQGLAAADRQQWAEAAQLFEASLAARDMPATRFNLMLANKELARPLEVIRHALAFLAGPDSGSREDARQAARRVLEEALGRVSILITSTLPKTAQLTIDGARPVLADADRVYVLPGVHQLEAQIDDGSIERGEVALQAGQTAPWPRPVRESPALAPTQVQQPQTELPRALRDQPDSLAPPAELDGGRLARALGGTGAALAVAAIGCYWGTVHKGNDLVEREVDEVGYPAAADSYGSLKRSVMPLAFASGVVMASGVATSRRFMRKGSLVWSVGALVVAGAALGWGAALLIREPEALIENTRIDSPARQAGSLLVSAALPLLTYGVGFQLVRRSGRPVAVTNLLPLHIVW